VIRKAYRRYLLFRSTATFQGKHILNPKLSYPGTIFCCPGINIPQNISYLEKGQCVNNLQNWKMEKLEKREIQGQPSRSCPDSEYNQAIDQLI
jgi:hypothetical protein